MPWLPSRVAIPRLIVASSPMMSSVPQVAAKWAASAANPGVTVVVLLALPSAAVPTQPWYSVPVRKMNVAR